MPTFEDDYINLASLETFYPKAFEDEDESLQEVCRFVLTLSLVYNDCKDLIYAYKSLLDAKPSGEPEKAPIWGTYFGMLNHVIRLEVGLIHELLDLIKRSEAVLSHSSFRSVIRQLPQDFRGSWNALVNVAIGKRTSSPLGKAILLIRNKISYHYDTKEIYRGYRERFLEGSDPGEVPLISRGDNMEKTRFYFVDAAAESYLRIRLSEGKNPTSLEEVGKTLIHINGALNHIIGKFVISRGYAFRKYSS